MFSHLVLFIHIFYCYILFSYIQAETEGYGPYSVEVHEFKLYCNVSKQMSINMGIDGAQREVMLFNITFKTPMVVDEIKYEFTKVSSGKSKGSSLMRKTLKKPCSSPYFKMIMPPHFVVPTANGLCLMNGTFSVRYNLQASLQAILGPQFYYGIFRSRVSFHSKRKPLYCVTATYLFKKPSE